jgi:thiol-disulfide isomerase/thioredoxin
MIVAVLVFYGLKGDFSRKEQSPTVAVERDTKKLRLDIPKTPTAAPNFELKDPAGQPLSLSELKGKVVFVNFWATWCLPCIEEMPAMEKLHQELQKEGLVILAVNFQEGPARVKEFLTEHNLTFMALLDRDGKVAERYLAWALPVSVIINKRGEIVARAMGSKDWDSKESLQYFRQLLAQEA